MMTGPQWLNLARAELGTKEIPGPPSNPTVEQYYAEAAGGKAYSDDVPWCAAFVGAMLARSSREPSGSLLAKSYLDWGAKLAEPIPGAIAVFSRGKHSWQGHVAIVESVGKNTVTVIGGNQGDAVTRARYPKSKVLGYRWPKGAKA